MSDRRHKLMGDDGELVDIRDRYTFEPRQATAKPGEKIMFFHDDVFEHTVINRSDGVEKVNVTLQGTYFGNASFIVYCTEDDIVISREILYKEEGAKDFILDFPEGSPKVYVSSVTGTTRIYKRILRFHKEIHK